MDYEQEKINRIHQLVKQGNKAIIKWFSEQGYEKYLNFCSINSDITEDICKILNDDPYFWKKMLEFYIAREVTEIINYKQRFLELWNNRCFYTNINDLINVIHKEDNIDRLFFNIKDEHRRISIGIIFQITKVDYDFVKRLFNKFRHIQRLPLGTYHLERLPETINNLRNLQRISNFDANIILNELPDLYLPDLEIIRLRNTKIENIPYLDTPKLKELTLENNKIRVLNIEGQKDNFLPELEEVRLTGNPIEYITESVLDLPKLRILTVSGVTDQRSLDILNELVSRGVNVSNY